MQTSTTISGDVGRQGGRRRFCGGFTIVELLLVVVVIALVAGAGGVIYAGSYRAMLAKKAVREFVLGARYARIKAVGGGSVCVMKLEAAEPGFTLLVCQQQDGSAAQMVPLQDGFHKRAVKFPDRVRFEVIRITEVGLSEEAAGEGSEIVFAPNGTAQAAVIQIGDGRNHWTVQVNPATGQVEARSGTADEIEPMIVDLDRQ